MKIVNVAAAVKCLVFYLLFNDSARFYPHADLNMAENLIVRLEVAVDSVQRLVDSLDRGTQAHAGRILLLQSLVRQLQHLLHRWKILRKCPNIILIPELGNPRLISPITSSKSESVRLV